MVVDASWTTYCLPCFLFHRCRLPQSNQRQSKFMAVNVIPRLGSILETINRHFLFHPDKLTFIRLSTFVHPMSISSFNLKIVIACFTTFITSPLIRRYLDKIHLTQIRVARSCSQMLFLATTHSTLARTSRVPVFRRMVPCWSICRHLCVFTVCILNCIKFGENKLTPSS